MIKNLMLASSTTALVLLANVCGCGICKANATDKMVKYSSAISNEDPKAVTLKITGMSCAGCASHIHKELSKTPGIISDKIKYPGDVALIKYDASKISVDEIIKVIDKAGYKAEVKKEKKEKSN